MRALIPAVEERFGGEHKRILLVTHAATVIALTRELVGDRDLPLRVGCCTLTNLERPQGVRDAVGCWQPKKLADGGHLKDGVTRDWGFDNCIIIDGKVKIKQGVEVAKLTETSVVFTDGSSLEADAIILAYVPFTLSPSVFFLTGL